MTDPSSEAHSDLIEGEAEMERLTVYLLSSEDD